MGRAAIRCLRYRTVRGVLKLSTGTTIYRDDTVKTVTEICGWVDSSTTVKGGIRCVAQVIWHLTSILDTIILSQG